MIITWLYVHLGIPGSGPWYGFWSGFGSDLAEVAILGSILSLYKHHKCVSCFRFAHHQTPDTGQRICHKHYTRDDLDRLRADHKLKYPFHLAHAKLDRSTTKQGD